MQQIDDLILEVYNVTFEARYILKVTWDNMAPVYPSQTKEVRYSPLKYMIN